MDKKVKFANLLGRFLECTFNQLLKTFSHDVYVLYIVEFVDQIAIVVCALITLSCGFVSVSIDLQCGYIHVQAHIKQ